MKSIRQIKNLKGKTVLLRVDFNVPIKDGKVVDDFRIRKSIPTIEFLIKKGARVVILTHLGKDGSESLDPVIKHFSKISGFYTEVTSSVFELPEGPTPSLSRRRAQGRKNRRRYEGKPEPKIFFLQNIREFKGETENDLNFAKDLAKLGDIYVNDAFSVSHREHASVVGLPKFLPSYAGFQMEEEIKNLSKLLKSTKHPFLYIAGGAKFSTKIPLIKKYLKLADHVFVGGALANDFLKNSGLEVGKSSVSKETFGIKNVLKNKKIILPSDVLLISQRKIKNRKVGEIKKDEIILDIGKETITNLEFVIRNSKLILWNGPLGKYEDGGDKATIEIMNFILNQKNKEIILGGGDLVSLVPKKILINKNQKPKNNIFISTGGGATLEFLAKGTLSGIKALK